MSKGLPLVVIMSVANIFFASYAAVTREAVTARRESQKLLAELQVAHQQLQVYAAQAEELAVAAERKRAQEALEAAHAFQQSIIDGVALEWMSTPGTPQFYLGWAVFSVNSWCWTMFVLYIGMRFLDFSNSFLKYWQEAILPFFLFHPKFDT